MSNEEIYLLCEEVLIKNPVIPPKDTRNTWLTILKHHKELSTSGPELTLRNVRLQHRVPGRKRQIRKGIKLCGHHICKYPNPQGRTQQIAISQHQE